MLVNPRNRSATDWGRVRRGCSHHTLGRYQLTARKSCDGKWSFVGLRLTLRRKHAKTT